jgi:hypothetical protein
VFATRTGMGRTVLFIPRITSHVIVNVRVVVVMDLPPTTVTLASKTQSVTNSAPASATRSGRARIAPHILEELVTLSAMDELVRVRLTA